MSGSQKWGTKSLFHTAASAQGKCLWTAQRRKMGFIPLLRRLSRPVPKKASYGVSDVQYAYILQTNETDFSFFQRICTLEGCAFLVYDGTLVLYAQSYLEGIPPAKTITITSDGDYSFVDHSARLYGSCRIERGLYQGNFHVDNGGTRQYVPDMDVPITISSQAEADRYAKNLLRSVNKGMLYGYFYGRVMPEFAAASTANIENDRATSWNGHVFFTHIRNDYGKGRSKVFFRKPLDGY